MDQQIFTPVVPSSHQLCLLVKNCSTEFVIQVGRHTPLVWILGMNAVKSKLCYYSIQDLSIVRSQIFTDDIHTMIKDKTIQIVPNV